jgi:hypothetical protein
VLDCGGFPPPASSPTREQDEIYIVSSALKTGKG